MTILFATLWCVMTIGSTRTTAAWQDVPMPTKSRPIRLPSLILSVYVLYVQVLGASGLAIQVTLFEAAMPPMITAAILAKEKDLDPELATLMVAVGLPLSFITLTGWWWVLQGV